MYFLVFISTLYFLVFTIWELVRFVCVCAHNPLCLPTAKWVLTAERAVDWLTGHSTSSVSYYFENFIMGNCIVIT